MSTPVDFADARFRRDVQRIHALGPRVVFELLAELAARRLMRTEIEGLAARYAAIDPRALAAAASNQVPR
jgi:hypothetical protein